MKIIRFLKEFFTTSQDFDDLVTKWFLTIISVLLILLVWAVFMASLQSFGLLPGCHSKSLVVKIG